MFINEIIYCQACQAYLALAAGSAFCRVDNIFEHKFVLFIIICFVRGWKGFCLNLPSQLVHNSKCSNSLGFRLGLGLLLGLGASCL